MEYAEAGVELADLKTIAAMPVTVVSYLSYAAVRGLRVSYDAFVRFCLSASGCLLLLHAVLALVAQSLVDAKHSSVLLLICRLQMLSMCHCCARLVLSTRSRARSCWEHSLQTCSHA
jgi:hypothetical protein